jgi:hypothetical protein
MAESDCFTPLLQSGLANCMRSESMQSWHTGGVTLIIFNKSGCTTLNPHIQAVDVTFDIGLLIYALYIHDPTLSMNIQAMA